MMRHASSADPHIFTWPFEKVCNRLSKAIFHARGERIFILHAFDYCINRHIIKGPLYIKENTYSELILLIDD